ncbi:hypothetical protein [Aeromicrobium sp. UC242_57]|uniref:hypothetical protein n=1 Tax=Aeromicrobium sp. UC242_57 TaxID=3374624 RepID=UPI0037AEF863
MSTGLSPALHYLRVGAADAKDPGPAFSTRKYLGPEPWSSSRDQPAGPLPRESSRYRVVTNGPDPQSILDELALLSDEQRLRREIDLVADLVDLPYYAVTVPDVLEDDLDPVEHFCREGWRELRKPRQDFDVWWYWTNHMDPSDDTINPLVHYALIGQAQGLSTRPLSTDARPGHRLPADRPIRRACLFAGYDVDGVVDPSVIERW